MRESERWGSERGKEREREREKNVTVGQTLQSSRTLPITILTWFDHYWMCSIAIHFTV